VAALGAGGHEQRYRPSNHTPAMAAPPMPSLLGRCANEVARLTMNYSPHTRSAHDPAGVKKRAPRWCLARSRFGGGLDKREPRSDCGNNRHARKRRVGHDATTNGAPRWRSADQHVRLQEREAAWSLPAVRRSHEPQARPATAATSIGSKAD
jgi:hypothetical protein